jgi:hypothetical protein
MTNEKRCSVDCLLTKLKVIRDFKKCLGKADVEHRLMPIWNLKKKRTTEEEDTYFFQLLLKLDCGSYIKCATCKRIKVFNE